MNLVIFGGIKCSKKYYNEIYNFMVDNVKNKEVTVVSGGTIGTMEAICKGAKQNGLKTVAVSLAKWKDYINEYVDEIKLFDNELDRLNYFISIGDVYICLDGDIGTMTELFPTWLYVMDNDKKLYITGEKNERLLKCLYENEFIGEYTKEYMTVEKLKNIVFV